MTHGKTKVSTASLKVMADWGIETIYGIPSGTLAPLMEALGEQEETNIELASLLQLAANKIGISKASIGVTIFSLILVVLANKLAKPTYYSLQTIF